MRKILLLSTILLITSIVSAQSVKIDKRAEKYYTKEEIQSMPPEKIKQINTLYTKSFIIPDQFKNNINPNDIDIREYSKERLPFDRAKVYLKEKTNTPETDIRKKEYIILLSINELKTLYSKIK
jgi:hypothetical protein